jgi:hypothetical protein
MALSVLLLEQYIGASAGNVRFDLITHHSSKAKTRREVLRQTKVLQGACGISLSTINTAASFLFQSFSDIQSIF